MVRTGVDFGDLGSVRLWVHCMALPGGGGGVLCDGIRGVG